MIGRAAIAVLIVGLISLSWPAPRQTTPRATVDARASDEFVGPFPSWTNVKTAYRAVGDGAADDTAALQQGLTELGTPGHSPVLYLPRGTYRITQTLTLAAALNVSIVGEDPAATTIVWDGAAGSAMLWINGVAYSRFGRLTFDGRRRAAVAVEQTWDNVVPRGNFDTGNEYADDRFVDTEYGIHGGFKNVGFAETSIVRARFVRNTRAGIALGNFNALDIWVWDSLFDSCGTGVTNGTGAGNFHLYDSVFRQSTVADLSMGNTGGFSARGNYSSGSAAFFVSVLNKSYPATIHLQRNTIVDPTGPRVIDLRNQGPGLLTDNVVRSNPATPAPTVQWLGVDGADVVSVGNTFTVANPIRANGRLVSIDDRVVSRAAITATEPPLPDAARNLMRPVFEVPAGARASAIQQAIDAAAAQNGRRPIVHLPYGLYAVSETLTIPPSDVQVVGDGFGTTLRWAGTGRGPVVLVKGPTKATFREIQIDGAATADAVVVDRADQPGSRVYLDQLQLRSGSQANLLIKGLNEARIELRDVGYAYSPTGASIKVTGASRTNIFSGASSGNGVSYDLSGGARVLVRDMWYESGAGPGFANVHDAATFTVDGARISSPVRGTPAAFNLVNLNGSVAVLASDLDDRIEVTGDGSNARVLGLAIMDEQPSLGYFFNRATPPAQALLVNSRNRRANGPGNRSVPTTDVGGAADAAFIKNQLAHTRGEMPVPLSDLPAGVTDLRMFRVWVTGGLANLTLTP